MSCSAREGLIAELYCNLFILPQEYLKHIAMVSKFKIGLFQYILSVCGRGGGGGEEQMRSVISLKWFNG